MSSTQSRLCLFVCVTCSHKPVFIGWRSFCSPFSHFLRAYCWECGFCHFILCLQACKCVLQRLDLNFSLGIQWAAPLIRAGPRLLVVSACNEPGPSWCQHLARPVKETFLVFGRWARPSVVNRNLSRPKSLTVPGAWYSSVCLCASRTQSFM